jgi:chromosome segregation ATPase
VELLMLRAGVLVSQERLFNQSQRSNPEYFPRFYFVLVPVGKGRMGDLRSADQWNGVLNSLKGEIQHTHHDHQESSRALDKKIMTVESRLGTLEEAIVKKMEARMGTLEETIGRKIETVEGRMGRIEEVLERIEAALREHKRERVEETTTTSSPEAAQGQAEEAEER